MTGPATFVYEGVFSPEGLMTGAGLKPTPQVDNLYPDDNAHVEDEMNDYSQQIYQQMGYQIGNLHNNSDNE